MGGFAWSNDSPPLACFLPEWKSAFSADLSSDTAGTDTSTVEAIYLDDSPIATGGFPLYGKISTSGETSKSSSSSSTNGRFGIRIFVNSDPQLRHLVKEPANTRRIPSEKLRAGRFLCPHELHCRLNPVTNIFSPPFFFTYKEQLYVFSSNNDRAVTFNGRIF